MIQLVASGLTSVIDVLDEGVCKCHFFLWGTVLFQRNGVVSCSCRQKYRHCVGTWWCCM